MKFIVSEKQDDLSLYYGMKRQEVRKIFNCQVSEFKKSEFSQNTADSFDEIHIHCFYNGNDELSEIEIFRPNKFYIYLYPNFNWMNCTNNEILEFLSKNNFSENIQIEEGIVINSYAIATITDCRLLTECCYVDLEKISYLNIEQTSRSLHKPKSHK